MLLVIVFLLAMCQASHAADLQAGWYADIDRVYVYTYDPVYHNPTLTAEPSIQIAAGQYGPFTVTAGPYDEDYTRYVSVSADAYGVGSSQGLILPLYMAWSGDQTIGYISVGCATNYDPTQMYLGLYQTLGNGTTATIWTQMQNGGGSSGFIGQNTSLANGPFYLEVAVVPEPSGFVVLLAGAAALYARLRGIS